MPWKLVANIRGPRGFSVKSAAIGTDGRLRLTLTSGEVLSAGIARGPQGLPGLEDVPTDPGIAELIRTEGTSETQVALDERYEPLEARPVHGILAGAGLTLYSNSWGASDAENTGPATRAINMLADDLDSAYLRNASGDAYRVQDAAAAAIGTTAPWETFHKGLVIVDPLLNNLIEPDDAGGRATALEGLRAIVAVLSSKRRYEQTDFTFSSSPGWINTDSPAITASKGTQAVTQSTGAYVTIPTPAGVSYICFTGFNGTTARGGIFTITMPDGTAIGAVDTDNKTRTTDRLTTIGASPLVVRVELAVAANLRATFSTAGRAGAYGVIDALFVQSETPPPIMLVKPLPVIKSTHSKPALLTELRTYPDVVKAEFGSHVFVADALPVWNPNTMLGGDQLHPNDAGFLVIKNAWLATLEAEYTRRYKQAVFGITAES
jgi:hypothetical protein